MSDEQESTEEIGIPDKLRVRRGYTMSEAALAQRRDAAQQPKPGLLGNRNNFRHGRFAADFVGRLKPCKSTCPLYPCEMVSDGATQPGGDCLDIASLMQFFSAVRGAVKNRSYDDFNELASLQIANNMKILEMLQEDIMRDGTVLKREKMTAHGMHIEFVPHPSLLSLNKMIADIGITPAEMLITPRAQKRADTDEKGAEGLAAMMSKLGKNFQQAEE